MSHAWKAYGMGIPKEQALQGMGCLLRLANIWLTGRLNHWYPSSLFILPNAFIKDSLYMVSIRHKSWIHTSGWPISQSIYCSFSASPPTPIQKSLAAFLEAGGAVCFAACSFAAADILAAPKDKLAETIRSTARFGGDCPKTRII